MRPVACREALPSCGGRKVRKHLRADQGSQCPETCWAPGRMAESSQASAGRDSHSRRGPGRQRGVNERTSAGGHPWACNSRAVHSGASWLSEARPRGAHSTSGCATPPGWGERVREGRRNKGRGTARGRTGLDGPARGSTLSRSERGAWGAESARGARRCRAGPPDKRDDRGRAGEAVQGALVPQLHRTRCL